jgi:hypothetical protein
MPYRSESGSLAKATAIFSAMSGHRERAEHHADFAVVVDSHEGKRGSTSGLTTSISNP